MKTRYAIVSANDPEELVNRVNSVLAEGWLLVGGLTTTPGEGNFGTTFFQPVKFHEYDTESLPSEREDK